MHGFSAGEPFQRGLRARIFLAVERKAAILAVNRHEALVEMPALDRGAGALLAFKPKLINVLPRDAFQRRDRVGADALMRLRMAVRAGADCRRPS